MVCMSVYTCYLYVKDAGKCFSNVDICFWIQFTAFFSDLAEIFVVFVWICMKQTLFFFYSLMTKLVRKEE